MSSTAVDSRQAERRATANAINVAHETSESSEPASVGEKLQNERSAKLADRRNVLKRRKKEEHSNFNPINFLPLFLIGVIYVGFRYLSSKQKPVFNWNDTQYVYAFGDSYTSVQGTAGRAGFSFIGDASDRAFTPAELLSNQIAPKSTISGGSNWIQFLTGCHEGRPSDCSPHQLWDFAFAEADIDAKILPLHHDFSVDLVDQVKQWASYAANVVPHPPENTLTAWWIGNHDTRDASMNSTITDWTLFWHAEMRSYFNAVEFVVGRGLRGTHLFINVPPGQPARNDDLKGQALQKRTVEFNTILSGYIQGFAARHRHLNVLSFDAYTWFNEVLDNAGEYGFTNTTGFCKCSDPTFFWYDNGHITERAHKLLADAIEAQLLAASS